MTPVVATTIAGVAIVGLALLFGGGKKKTKATPCPIDKVNQWAMDRNLGILLVLSRDLLQTPPPGTPAGPVQVNGISVPIAGVVVQNECQFYIWNGNAWVVDAAKTMDMMESF